MAGSLAAGLSQYLHRLCAATALESLEKLRQGSRPAWGGVLLGPGLPIVRGPAAEAFAEGIGKVRQGVEAGRGRDLAHGELGRDQQDPCVLQPHERAELHDRTADAAVELAFQLPLRDAERRRDLGYRQ